MEKEILLIDDDKILNFVNTRLCESLQPNATLKVFDGAVEALEYIDSEKERLDTKEVYLLLDIHMPEMSGFEFLEALTEEELVLNNMKIAILTSSIDWRDRQQAGKYELVNNFFEKPLSRRLLSAFLTGS